MLTVAVYCFIVRFQTSSIPDPNGVCPPLKLDAFALQLVSGGVDAARAILSSFYA